MIESVIRFDPQGNGHCLYTEAVDLSTIGPLEITRASTLEFNRSSQKWEVMDLGGQLLFSHRSREVCLKWELQKYVSDLN
jgi:hypothetical protein